MGNWKSEQAKLVYENGKSFYVKTAWGFWVKIDPLEAYGILASAIGLNYSVTGQCTFIENITYKS